ncbi:hypothetical protein CU098_004442 [Rhizopus stolonifer]|uniref:ERAD-associated protein n=1 Tax=Rhizopus stolonifer TaxID=4846 RepID=A0A367JPI7_RHIST|nr:hypothetical protein CU098_004442 [Rhizopus stolonifer]
MTAPELNTPNLTLNQLHTSKEIVNHFEQNPLDTFDTLVNLFSSSRMKQDPEFQREAFRACELWIAITDDPSAKVCIARCKLSGWGTNKDPVFAFTELKRLAAQGTWEAYFFLAQCYYYGVDKVQGKDKQKACEWYQRTIQMPYSTSRTAPYFVAQAQVCVAITRLLEGGSLDENVSLIKQSADAGNKIAEFQLGYLIKLGVTSDTKTTREYFIKSANKSYSPAQVQLAQILLKEGNTNDGLEWLRKATELNDPQAYYVLGNIYELGSYGVRPNFELAYSNYHHAVEQHNHRPSEFRLGMNYLTGGLGLIKDPERAFEFIQSAAQAGEPGAQYVLGVMYREGEIPQTANAQNKKEAFRWFRRAAAQNLSVAITQMALCYEQGVGVAVNHEVASQYYERAVGCSDRYMSSAQVAYARFLCHQKKYKQGFEYYLKASGLVQPNTTSPQVTAEAKRMVAIFYLDNTKDSDIPYKPKEGFDLLMELSMTDPNNGSHYSISAKLGYADSQLHQDRRSAFDWFMKAAEQKSPKALNYVGLYYYKGTFGIPSDHDKAREFFRKSAQLGEVDGMISYAQLCQEKIKTIGSDPEIKKLQRASFVWYKKAASQGHPKALRELGRLYGAGIGTEKNSRLSFEHFKLAADKQDPLATLLLGGCYENGQTKDIHTALFYYLKAIELGQPTALLAAAEVYEKLGQYDKAYDYYGRVIADTRIDKDYKSNRTSRLKRALYNLNYDPTLLFYPMSSTLHSSTMDSFSHIPRTQAFQTIYSLATQDHFPDAYVWLAECYQDGNGIPQNMTESILWRTRAADVNDLYSIRKLAYIYEQGIHVKKDLSLSQRYRQLFASKHSIP